MEQSRIQVLFIELDTQYNDISYIGGIDIHNITIMPSATYICTFIFYNDYTKAIGDYISIS